ncbi:UNVERIFIED_CONTAM: hypothetical protein Sradi_1759900 [Sesamum radiatum]|uniref:PB1-like domain-containing protein n=1 Tax=Sesamum radiatum TaxID=300843 RepID=A0AAW2TUV5_SESRA
MVLGEHADFYVWLGGYLEWVPSIRYIGGWKRWFPNVDKDRLLYDNLVDMYTQASDQGSNIAIYYALPGETLDSFLKTVQGDEGIRELLRDYQGLNVISIYIEELSGPILAVDKHGNLLDTVVSVPQITYIDKRGEGAGNEVDEVVGEEGGEGARNKGGEVAEEEGGEGVGNEGHWVDWGDHGDTEWTEGGEAGVKIETNDGQDEVGLV